MPRSISSLECGIDRHKLQTAFAIRRGLGARAVGLLNEARGFPKIKGASLGFHVNKDYNIFWSVLASPYFGKLL